MHSSLMKHAAAPVAAALVSALFFANPAGAFQAGDTAPPFTLKDTGGREVSLESLRGKVVLLSFWECYTDVCFTSVDTIDKMLKKYPPGDFTAVTICFEVPPALAAGNYKALLEKCSAGQLILLDPGKSVRDLYGVSAGPTTFLIGRDLRIREKVVGVPDLRSDDFEQRVERMVSQPAGTHLIPAPPPD